MEKKTFKLVIFPSGIAVLISDENIIHKGKTDALCLAELEYGFYKSYIKNVADCNSCRPILASNRIGHLPGLDLSLVDVGIANIEELAEEYSKKSDEPYSYIISIPAFQEGFNKCLELNKEKKYTLEDINKAFEEGINAHFEAHELRTYEEREEYRQNKRMKMIESLSCPKIYDVEIEMETDAILTTLGVTEFVPSVRHNKIKILKIL